MRINRKKHNQIFSEEEPVKKLHWLIFSVFLIERQGGFKNNYQIVIVTPRAWILPLVFLLVLLTLIKNALTEAFDELRLERLITQIRINSKETMYIRKEKND